MPNPYAHGQPADPVKEFAGRDEELRRIRSCVESSRAGNITNVFVDGEWGIGKTSLLNKLRPELQEFGPVISEDLADDPQQVVWFYNALFSELMEAKPAGVAPEQFQDVDVRDSRRVRKLLKAAWEGLSDRFSIVIIMLDNLERADPAFLTGVRDVFQRLAHEHTRYMLVFAGRHLPVRDSDAADPVGRFFNPRVVLDPLDEAESIQAIRKPIRFLPFTLTDEAAHLISQRAAGHPYFLKLICHEVYDLSVGKGPVDVRKLERLWPDVEERLVVARFGVQFDKLPDGEQLTLLQASLLGVRFEARELRSVIRKSLDTYLDRLLNKRELLRSPGRGTYQLYHPLFRTFLQAKARERKLLSTTRIVVPEGRPAFGREQIEERIAHAAQRRLDIIDQHFRGVAVSMLEAAKPDVRIRILMGEDPAWPKTRERLDGLELGLRKRVEVRAWPDKSENQPVPWHYRCLIGDREVWRFDHSLEQAGKKKAYLTEATAERQEHERDFDRWWKQGKPIFPS